MMLLLPRYLRLNLLQQTLVILALLSLIILTNNLSLTLKDVINGKLSLDLLWHVSVLVLIAQGGFLLCFSYLLALLFFLASLYRSNEIYALRVLGIGTARLFAWLSLPSLLISLLVGLFVFYFTPHSHMQIGRLAANYLQHEVLFNLAEHTELSGKRGYRISGRELEVWDIGERSSSYSRGGFAASLDAVRSTAQGAVVRVELADGLSITWHDDGRVVETEFDYAEVAVPLNYQLGNLVSYLPTLTLLNPAALSEVTLSSAELTARQVELYERLLVFISSLLILPLALVTSSRRSGGSASRNILGGFLLYCAYIILAFMSIGVIRNGGTTWYFWLLNLGCGGGIALGLGQLLSGITHRRQSAAA